MSEEPAFDSSLGARTSRVLTLGSTGRSRAFVEISYIDTPAAPSTFYLPCYQTERIGQN
jgi:hypothetical protein